MDNPNIEHNKDTLINDSEHSAPTNTEATTYGAIYTPDAEGKGYSCSRYDADKKYSNSKVSDVEYAKKKHRKLPIAVIVIAAALCVLLSSAAALGVSPLVREFDNSQYQPNDLPEGTLNDIASDTNKVYIDNSPVYIEETVEPGELMSMENAIINVKDSVVEITTESLHSGFGGFSQYVVSGAGSGVVISSGGYIITNNHVIEGARNIVVRLTDGSQHKATLIGTDSQSDIAVLSISPPEGVILTPAVIGNSDNLKLGQTVIAIGNPLGELGGTVTDGIISCLAREIAIDGSGTMTLLQTNAAVSPGNSGGGLFDLYGRLVGVVNAKFSGDGVEGISFAIPMNTAWDIAQQLIDKGYVSGRPDLGVSLSQVEYGYSIFGSKYYQVVVSDPRNVAELKTNDIIVSINNQQVSTISELSDIISSLKIGDTVTLTVIRDRRYVDVKATLVEYSPDIKKTENRVNG